MDKIQKVIEMLQSADNEKIDYIIAFIEAYLRVGK